jgi:hypothetical protein
MQDGLMFCSAMGTPFLIATEVPGGLMAAIIADKYHLKSIHDDIGLFDRKLAHLMKFEKFDSEAARDEAARKLRVKRETLVQTALRLVAEGVEFKPGDRPRSMRPDDEPEIAAPVPVADSVKHAEPPAESRSMKRQNGGPYAGTSLDWQASVRQYMQKKGKA